MQFSPDWTERVGQINDFVGTQYAAMDMGELTTGQVMEYMYRQLVDTLGYEPEDGDVRALRNAVVRIMRDG